MRFEIGDPLGAARKRHVHDQPASIALGNQPLWFPQERLTRLAVRTDGRNIMVKHVPSGPNAQPIESVTLRIVQNRAESTSRHTGACPRRAMFVTSQPRHTPAAGGQLIAFVPSLDLVFSRKSAAVGARITRNIFGEPFVVPWLPAISFLS
jgi:hypothetical protein